MTQDSVNELEFIDCYECNGSGYVDCETCSTPEMEECTNCEGSGEIPNPDFKK